jgi:hypothetical protein
MIGLLRAPLITAVLSAGLPDGAWSHEIGLRFGAVAETSIELGRIREQLRLDKLKLVFIRWLRSSKP